LQQFSTMQDRVSSLQTAINTADLQEEATQLRSDLESTRKAMETPKATLSFAFVEDDGADANLVTLNMTNGIVKIQFHITNDSDADALEGAIDLRACDGCKILGNPDGFTKLNGEPDNEREMDFQHVFANSKLPKVEMQVIPPPNSDAFQIGIWYRCRTCVLVNTKVAVPRNNLGTVLLEPHYRVRPLPPSLVSPFKK